MRLTVGILAAMLCHGLLFGVAAAVLSHRSIEARLAPETVEVEVVAAKPDRIADAAPAAIPAPATTPSQIPPRRRAVARPALVAVATAREPAASITPTGTEIPIPVLLATTSASASLVTARSAARPIEGSGTVLMAKPRYRTNPTPEYPIASRRRGEEGVVLLNVAVEMNGAPSAISLSRSSGYPLLDRAALEAVHRWTFEPARAGGVPVFSLVVVPVRFSLADRP